MACSGYIKNNNKCKHGFNVTTGCFATSLLEKNMMKYVECINEELCGRVYNDNGGKPKISEVKL